MPRLSSSRRWAAAKSIQPRMYLLASPKWLLQAKAWRLSASSCPAVAMAGAMGCAQMAQISVAGNCRSEGKLTMAIAVPLPFGARFLGKNKYSLRDCMWSCVHSRAPNYF
jgi:hypothetical protein